MLTSYKDIFDGLNKKGIYHFGSYISASQYTKAYDLVRKYGRNKLNVLDWVTGSGHFSYFLSTQGYDVTAFTIEQESNLANYLKNSFSNKYKLLSNQNPVKPLPFNNDCFDMVVSIGVLEHVMETGNKEINSLLEIRRVLKQNGIFICYHFPNKYSWIESITKHLQSKYNHRFKYSYKDIIKITGMSNLEILEVVRYGILPRNTFRVAPNNLLLTKIFNIIDSTLSVLLNPFCQNYYFVARKLD